MKRFIKLSLIFTLPFAILYSYTNYYYKPAEGDLIRLGKIPYEYDNKTSYAEIETLKKEMPQAYYEKISNSSKNKFKILVVGDSFSGQGNYGYKNFLAKRNDLLWLDYSISDNPIQTLTAIANSDFFDNYNIEYVILESVERSIIKRIEEDYNPKMELTTQEIILRSKQQNTGNSDKEQYKFFSNATVTFPIESQKFYYKKNYLSNHLVWNIELNTSDLFSNKSDKLLCYVSEIRDLEENNSKESATKLNVILNDLNNKLNQKNVKLIVLVATDKYDFYYDYIKDKQLFTRPRFFENFNKLDKNYIYIDSKSILNKYLENYKDLYYYGDTHWSPISAKIVAKTIENSLKNQSLK